MKKKIENKILDKYIKGEYSWNEYLQVKNMFDDIRKSNELKNYMSDHLNEFMDSDFPKDKSLDHIFKEVDYHILLEEKKKPHKLTMWGYYKQIAAIFLIPVLLFSGWYIMNERANSITEMAWVEIEAPNSSRIQFSLPDGSSGWLNSGSTLRYNMNFIDNRQVNLKGEAYFDVKPSDVIFNVKTADLNVNVLGTSFNVSDYENDRFSHVVLVEGKVQVSGQKNQFNKTLSPGERLLVNTAAEIMRLDTVDIERLTAWKDGYLMLDNESFEHAAKRMERKYNVDISIEDDQLKRYRIKATFEDEPLEEVLRLLSLSTPMEYSIERSNDTLDENYKKKRVRLKLK